MTTTCPAIRYFVLLCAGEVKRKFEFYVLTVVRGFAPITSREPSILRRARKGTTVFPWETFHADREKERERGCRIFDPFSSPGSEEFKYLSGCCVAICLLEIYSFHLASFKIQESVDTSTTGETFRAVPAVSRGAAIERKDGTSCISRRISAHRSPFEGNGWVGDGVRGFEYVCNRQSFARSTNTLIREHLALPARGSRTRSALCPDTRTLERIS